MGLHSSVSRQRSAQEIVSERVIAAILREPKLVTPRKFY